MATSKPTLPAARRDSPSIAGMLLAGALAGGGAQLLELALVGSRIGPRVALIAIAIAMAAGAATLVLAAAALRAVPIRWLPSDQRTFAARAPGTAGLMLLLSLLGAGALIHLASGTRSGWAKLALGLLAWIGFGALAGGSRIAGWLVLERWTARRRAAAWLLLPLVIWCAALASELLSRRAGNAVQRVPPPGSVVWIVLDTTRAAALGAYGASPGETPVFDRLALRGEKWNELISESPWTVPSHATFFTGLSPRTHDCWFGGRRWLDEELETVAERLRAGGFETAAFFGNAYLPDSNLLQGFERREDLRGPQSALALGWLMRYSGIGLVEWIDRGATRAVGEVDAWLARRRSDRPFLLFVNLFETHEPYVSPIADHLLPPGVGEVESFLALRRYREQQWHALGRRQGRDEEIVRAAYRSSVRFQDRMLGRLLATIDRHVALDRLALVVTADHGENLGEAGRWGHQFALDDQLLRIPLVVVAPGRTSAGRRVDGAFSAVDLPATVLDLAHAGTDFGAGRSLLRSREPAGATFAEDYPYYTTLQMLELDFEHDLGDARWPMSAVRAEGYKLVLWHGGPTRLYDLRTDPNEEHDVIAAHPDVASRLLARFAGWSREHPRQHRDRFAGSHPKALDPQIADELRALGYL